MALTPPTSRVVRAAREMPGIVDFEGPVVDAAAADAELLGSGLTACIGTDQAMLDLVPALVDAGCRIRVFEDRPRLVLPDGLGLPGRAGTVRALASATAQVRRATAGVPAPALVRRALADEQVRLERRAGSLHRHRHLHDRWLRRQLTPSPHDDRPPLHGDGFYRVLGSGRVPLISWPIAKVTARGVRTCDGLEHRVDAIVVAR
jgi:cation diffusion facilitator CzcD-associated flavoprotein CzcO